LAIGEYERSPKRIRFVVAMKVRVIRVPPDSPLRAGQLITLKQSAELLEINAQVHARHALMASTFTSRDGKYQFEFEREAHDPFWKNAPADPNYNAEKDLLSAEQTRRIWLEEKRARGEPVTRQVLSDMGFSKIEIPDILNE